MDETYNVWLKQQTLLVMHLYGGNIEKSVSQYVLKTNDWNLKCMFKVTFSYNQTFILRGYLPLLLGYIHI